MHEIFMFDYKDASFFTAYFQEHSEFNLIEEFNISQDDGEKDLYVGSIEVLNTIHHLVLRVEIPFSFPHNRLVFRTKSLRGYPHLIHRGKVRYGDWFCLNTPFAETVEEQLNQEVSRLKEWISRQMRPELPPVIEDENVRRALAFANAYDWENPDEVNEFSSKALLTFVGNYQGEIDVVKEKKGYLHCIKTPDDRFYAFKEKTDFTKHDLPYIVVDEMPSSVGTLDDFIALKRHYGWNEEMCNHLLSGFVCDDSWRSGGTFFHSEKFTKEEGLNLVQNLRNELFKEETYLPKVTNGSNKIPVLVLPSQKSVILSRLDELEKSIEKKNGYKGIEDFLQESEVQEEGYYEKIETGFEKYQYKYHCFAFGVKSNEGIHWFIMYANRSEGVYEEITYDLSIELLEVKKIISHPLHRLGVQSIDRKLFFGRGELSANLRAKKIALVGLGAIGSMVAESLAHSGLSSIALWDSDIVEPGNICRSSYNLGDLGESKVDAIARKIQLINPFIAVEEIEKHGRWLIDVVGREFVGGSFYNNINYENQSTVIEKIKNYELVIDCTGNNEILHFLSYALPDSLIVSLCITNHANELLCVTNRDGNPFELRKAFLSRIEQDTKNFYIEGAGCYSPTFLAINCDIASLVHLAVRELNLGMEKGMLLHSIIFSHTKRGVLSDRIQTYQLNGYDIVLNVATETLLDAEDMDDVTNGNIGYVFGCYSVNGDQIIVTHIVDAITARMKLEDAYNTSKGIIDYIGDYAYSGVNPGTYQQNSLELIADKANDESINTNNPLLAVRNPDRTISFFLYINGKAIPFVEMND